MTFLAQIREWKCPISQYKIKVEGGLKPGLGYVGRGTLILHPDGSFLEDKTQDKEPH